jgi:hypothetical protein
MPTFEYTLFHQQQSHWRILPALRVTVLVFMNIVLWLKSLYLAEKLVSHPNTSEVVYVQVTPKNGNKLLVMFLKTAFEF